MGLHVCSSFFPFRSTDNFSQASRHSRPVLVQRGLNILACPRRVGFSLTKCGCKFSGRSVNKDQRLAFKYQNIERIAYKDINRGIFLLSFG